MISLIFVSIIENMIHIVPPIPICKFLSIVQNFAAWPDAETYEVIEPVAK